MHRPSRPAQGFTLLEMLVTLVVVSMVATLMTQAMYQIGRVERVMAEGQLDSMALALRAEWLRDAMAGVLPGELGSSERFKGAARELNGISTAVPHVPQAGLYALHLQIRFNERAGMTELCLNNCDRAASNLTDLQAEPSAVLLRWPGSRGGFRYQDDKGGWNDQWPPAMPGAAAATAGVAALPSLIVVETGLEQLPAIVAAPQAADVKLLKRSTLEQF